MSFQYIIVQIVIPVLTILISVFIAVYTVHGRIKNENKESHKPYLVLKEVYRNEDADPYDFYLRVFGREHLKVNNDSPNTKTLYLKCFIGNIGYGVASNIKFYDLNTGEQVVGNQVRDKEYDQKLYTTFDIAKEREKHVDMHCIYEITDRESIEQDGTILLCVYQDLNQKYDDFIIAINYKEKKHFDYYAFQRTSKSYKNLMQDYNNNYIKIM